MKRSKNLPVWIVITVTAAALIAIIAVWGIRRGSTSAAEPSRTAQQVQETFVPETVVVYQEVEKEVEVVKEVSMQTVQEQLRDMGKLITQEYAFTQVEQYSDKLMYTLFGHTGELDFTESYFLVGYDGVVSAGVEFGGITVEQEDSTVTVTVPKARIFGVDIDNDSFVLYEEKQNILNPVSVSDFNQSEQELKEHARQKALAMGILEKADENALRLIKGAVQAILLDRDLTVVVTTAK